MSNSSEFCREETVDALNQSLQDYGGLDVFSQVSATHVIHTVQQLQRSIRKCVPAHAFPKDGGINEVEILKVKSVTKQVLVTWLATAMDVMDRVVDQF